MTNGMGNPGGGGEGTGDGAGIGTVDGGDTGSQTQTTEAIQGGETPKWTAQLRGDLRGNEKLTNYKDISELGDAHLALMGTTENSIQMPGENATPEEMAAFYNKLGRPESHEQYNLNNVETPMTLNLDVERLTKDAHDLGISQQAFEGLVNAFVQNYNENEAKIFEEMEADIDKGVAELQGKWGAQYKARLQGAVNMLAKGAELAGITQDEFGEYIDNHPYVFNDPTLLKIVDKLNQAISEDSALDILGDRSKAGPQKDAFGKLVLDFPSMRT